MAFGSFESGSDAPMAEINMVPLIDVMLVLLLVFMITAPLMNHAIPLDLPRASNEPLAEEPERVAIAIDAAGQLYVDAAPVSRDALQEHFTQFAQRQPQPVLNLSIERETRYETVAQLLGDAKRLGLTRLAFVTSPNGDPGVADGPPGVGPAQRNAVPSAGSDGTSASDAATSSGGAGAAQSTAPRTENRP